MNCLAVGAITSAQPTMAACPQRLPSNLLGHHQPLERHRFVLFLDEAGPNRQPFSGIQPHGRGIHVTSAWPSRTKHLCAARAQWSAFSWCNLPKLETVVRSLAKVHWLMLRTGRRHSYACRPGVTELTSAPILQLISE